jgi:hypothetical protein
VARAGAAAPGFALDAGNLGAVVALCRRLDGIPLALEIAAGRVRALGVHTLADRMDDRFSLLGIGHRGVPARHQTLRAVIDWSWQLLTERERVVLRRLAVHADGCVLDAAEAVCSPPELPGGPVVEPLARLVDRSLVMVVDSEHGPRYRLLQSVAAYCVERLREAGELESVQRQHQRYYIELAQRAEPHLRGPDQRGWLARLDAETENMRSALAGALQGNSASCALRLVNALAWYWFQRGRLSEAERSLAAAVTLADDTDSPARSLAQGWRAGLALLLTGGADRAARRRATQDLGAAIEDRRLRARITWFLGFALFSAGADLEASEQRVTQALALARTADDAGTAAAALSTRAGQELTRGNLEAAGRAGQDGLVAFRELGDRWGQLQCTYYLAAAAEIAGDYERAGEFHRDGLRLADDLGLRTVVADRITGLGRIALLRRDHYTARLLHEQAMALAADQGYRAGEVHAEIGLALVARRMDELDVAERHLHSVLEWHREVDFGPGPALILAELGFVAEQRGDAGAATARHLEGWRAARATGDPRAVALALEGLAGARALAGEHAQAARLLGTAARARESVGAPLPPAERGDVNRITERTRAVLGEDDFVAEFEHGGRMPLPEEIAE